MTLDGQVARATKQNRRRIVVLALITISFFIFLGLLPPFPQSLSYHVFADSRPLFGLPNAANVISSLALIIVGICGAASCSRASGADRYAEITLMVGLALVGTGSVFYHLHPTTDRLFWDRLPLALVVMSLVTLSLTWYISPRARMLLVPLISAGLGAGVAWRITAANGAEDLKWWWGTVEIYPVLLLAVVNLLFRAEARHRRTVLLVVGWFALAQVFDTEDALIYKLGHIVSGHTLKHFAGAAAGLAFLRSERMRDST